MNINQHTRHALLAAIITIGVLAQFLPTLTSTYTNSDIPAHFANALFTTLDVPVQYPVDIFHYRFYNTFKIGVLATVAVDAYLPLPPTYLFLLYPIYQTFEPLTSLSITYFLMALFSGLGALIIYSWLRHDTHNDLTALLGAILYCSMPIGYLYYAGGGFPQIMGGFFVFLALYCTRMLSAHLHRPAQFALLTAIITLSLLIHLGSAIGLLGVLFLILAHHASTLFKTHKYHIRTALRNHDATLTLLLGASLLLSISLAYFLYYGSFLDLFLDARTKSTTGAFLRPSWDQIYQLFRGYWILPLLILTGWRTLRTHPHLRTYLYAWFLCALIFFIANIDIRYVYLIYAPITMLGAVTLQQLITHRAYRTYILLGLFLFVIAAFLYSSTWWTYFAHTGYDEKIHNVLTAFRP